VRVVAIEEGAGVVAIHLDDRVEVLDRLVLQAECRPQCAAIAGRAD
jgi:hypothetical protein